MRYLTDITHNNHYIYGIFPILKSWVNNTLNFSLCIKVLHLPISSFHNTSPTLISVYTAHFRHSITIEP